MRLYKDHHFSNIRSSSLEVFWENVVLKICSKFAGKHPCRSAISIKLQSNFIEITLCHECSPVNLLHNFITVFPKNTSEGLLLKYHQFSWHSLWKNSGWLFNIHSHDELSSGLDHVLKYSSFICKMLTIYKKPLKHFFIWKMLTIY